jgi:hypothetical protein
MLRRSRTSAAMPRICCSCDSSDSNCSGALRSVAKAGATSSAHTASAINVQPAAASAMRSRGARARHAEPACACTDCH